MPVSTPRGDCESVADWVRFAARAVSKSQTGMSLTRCDSCCQDTVGF